MTGSITPRWFGLIGAVAVVATLSACDNTVNGSPTSGATTPSSPTSAPSSSNGSDPFVGMNPCSLLDQALAGQGYPASAPSTVNSEHSCDTHTSEATVGLALESDRTINDGIANPAKAQTGDVNGRPSVLAPENIGAEGDCVVMMEVTHSARATIIVTLTSGNTDQACTSAGNVATKVEPLLPPDR
ncbi:DUF3558 family protein [Amycolatopsis sp. NPDC051372]|uniref:DUF3558 family protein n=1 Tax=Amycolatopsis sp. NPDC051372 TaxID=3155669 RepID=UPI00342F61E5